MPCTWYVESMGDVARAHKIIAQFLEECHVYSSFHKDLFCADNRLHNLWDMPHKLLAKLWGSKGSLEIDIRVWRQRGSGWIRDITTQYARMQKRVRRAKVETANP